MFWRHDSSSWRDSGKISDKVIDELEEWTKRSVKGHNSSKGKTLATEPLPASFAALMDELVWNSDETSKKCKNEIIRCFGVDNLSTLIRRKSGGTSSVDIRTFSSQRDELLKLNLDINKDHLTSRGTTSTAKPIRISSQRRAVVYLRQVLENIDRAKNMAKSPEPLQSLFSEYSVTPWMICELVLPYLLGALGRQSYYLPADRTGIIHAHRVVVSALIEASSTAGLRPTHRLPMLSGVLSDFLQALIRIGSKDSKNNRSKTGTGSMIEANMLNGTIHIDQTPTGYPSFKYRPRGWRKSLPLMHTSSMVSELAPIILYLQQIVHHGDLLIIEEPESHLHPAMQATFAKILAEIVRGGVRIIVTTHSDWFLEQIGNLVRLSGLPLEDRHEITDGPALQRSEVGAWLFEESGTDGSSHVTEIEVDPDTGLYPVDYGRISDSLYNESAKIFNKMQERKDNE